MWLIRTALRSPYTFIVMAVLLAIFGFTSIESMPTDVFPEINIPVVSAIWTYSGMSADEMENRITTVVERAYTTTVNDIDHIESQSYDGVSVVKIYFHQGADVASAVAEMSAISGTVTRFLPPGVYPPYLIRYNAASVPILQLALGGKKFSEGQLFDIGFNFLRNDLATVKGASVLLPAGGKVRQVMVDLDPDEMYAKGVSSTDVINAVNAQSLILPAGSAKIGSREYNIRLNSSPEIIAELNDLPIKQVNGATVYVRDVAHVHDGSAVQENVVRLNAQRGSFVSILRAGGASTVDVVKNVRNLLPYIKSTLPEGLEIKQSCKQEHPYSLAREDGMFGSIHKEAKGIPHVSNAHKTRVPWRTTLATSAQLFNASTITIGASGGVTQAAVVSSTTRPPQHRGFFEVQ